MTESKGKTFGAPQGERPAPGPGRATAEGLAPVPSLEAILRPFPSGRVWGPWPDVLRLHAHKLGQATLRRFPGREEARAPHPRLLSAAAQEVLRSYRNPVCLETGCIHSPTDETESTACLASVLRGQATFYLLEEDEEHIEACRRICGNLNQWISYVQGEAASSIRRLRREEKLETVHLAFLDSVDDPEAIGAEFRALEELVVEGGLVIVEDSVRPGGRGTRVKQYLSDGTGWDVRLVHTWNGLLVAQRDG